MRDCRVCGGDGFLTLDRKEHGPKPCPYCKDGKEAAPAAPQPRRKSALRRRRDRLALEARAMLAGSKLPEGEP